MCTNLICKVALFFKTASGEVNFRNINILDTIKSEADLTTKDLADLDDHIDFYRYIEW